METRDLPKKAAAKRKSLVYLGLLVALFFVLELSGVTNLLKTPTQKIFVPVQAALTKSHNDIKNFITVITQVKSLREKETELAYENSLLLAENARLKRLEQENETLREQLGAKEVALEFLVAEVIGSDPLIESSEMVIDKGSGEGIEKGDLVVVKDILVGEIVAVGEATARVRLPNDPLTKIPAETESGVDGLLSGQFGNQVVLERIEQGKTVNSGELVLTSGKADMPKGLVLGSVEEVENNPSALFQKALIKPILPYEDLEIVFVVKK